MCGIGGQLALNNQAIGNLTNRLGVMSKLLAHRGPDGEGQWQNEQMRVGFVHRRLAIIDLSESAAQPMKAANDTVISFNGEIYNYPELRQLLSKNWSFKSNSDTECILATYDNFGDLSLNHLRGMFAFALWDESKQRLFCARDRFGIKPFYYAVVDGIFHLPLRPRPFCHF